MPTMHLDQPKTTGFQTSMPMSAQMDAIHLLFKQRGAGRENDNCVGLKLIVAERAQCAATSENTYKQKKHQQIKKTSSLV